jgi:hypothetical protein
MSKKTKTSEFNDIINSSYTNPDYSCGNEYYDEIDDHRRRTTHNGGGGGGSSGNPFSKISIAYAPASAPAPTSHTNTSNIFLKYTNTNTNTNAENGAKSTAIPNSKEVKNIEDEFPSLGGSKKPSAQSISAPMNFKKIVETKKTLEVTPQVVHIKPKHTDYYDRFKIYEDVKYHSEKTARSKIYSSAYSDEDNGNGDDDGDDDDDY